MNNRLALALQILVVLASAGYSGYMAGHLPAIVPVHWNIEGKPDGYGPASTNLWLMPGIEAGMVLLTLLLPVLSPKRYEVTRFAKTYGYLMLLVTVMMAALHFVILNTAAGAKLDIGRAMLTILFGFFALIGNVLGKVKQNFYVGIRTPWTLADGRVWDATHREASHWWLVGGIAGLLLGLAGVPFSYLFVFLMAMTLTPVARSFVFYRRIVGK
ncbi:MAG TPA: SdpI family protein [Fimbriimonadaceae bacterium]|nr:SdpI family protein [Fimbriimonadaceae bacterium]